MLKEALEYLAALARNGENTPLTQKVTLTSPFDEEGHEYEFRVEPGEYGRSIAGVVEPFRPDVLEVTTLSSFIEAVKSGVAGEEDKDHRMIHVVDYDTVALKNIAVNQYGKRNTFLVAKHRNPNAFNFDTFYDSLSAFVIALQASFIMTDELAYLTRLASNLKAGSTVQSTDDGFSQVLTIKTGEITTADVKVNPRIWLEPIRTFTEITPVKSEFLIRLKQSGTGVPTIALFNVDGLRWRNETVRAIREFLDGTVELPILA
jgi:hypothetical protein